VLRMNLLKIWSRNVSLSYDFSRFLLQLVTVSVNSKREIDLLAPLDVA